MVLWSLLNGFLVFHVVLFFPHIFVWGSCFWFCIPLRLRLRLPRSRLTPSFTHNLVSHHISHNFVTHNSSNKMFKILDPAPSPLSFCFLRAASTTFSDFGLSGPLIRCFYHVVVLWFGIVWRICLMAIDGVWWSSWWVSRVISFAKTGRTNDRWLQDDVEAEREGEWKESEAWGVKEQRNYGW